MATQTDLDDSLNEILSGETAAPFDIFARVTALEEAANDSVRKDFADETEGSVIGGISLEHIGETTRYKSSKTVLSVYEDAPQHIETPVPTASPEDDGFMTAEQAALLEQNTGDIETLKAGKADLASPVFTGTPQVPSKTGAAGTDGTLIATEAQVTASLATEAGARNEAIGAAIGQEVANRNAAIAAASLASQTWLPAVATKSDLPPPSTLNPAVNYLCRVMKDSTPANNGVWQLVAGDNEWYYFSDNLDFIDETELDAAMSGEVTARNAAIAGAVDAETARAQTAENALNTAKAPLASPALTGTPTAPTAATATNSTQIATMAFVKAALPGDATASAPGLMSAADKTKTDKLVVNAHADMVNGAGRDLRLVFGIASTDPAVYIPQIMAQIRTRRNGTGIPDFTGIEIGDWLDGLDLSAIPAENSGTAGQEWNETYKNNRIVVSGFNTYKDMGGTENTKNHVLFTFRNIPLKKRMNAANDNTGGYKASELRAFLEGTNGDGTGDKSGVTTAAFMNALKAQLGDYLYTIRKYHSTKSGNSWANYTVWPVSEIEMFGVPVYGDEGVYMSAITSPSIAARAGAITPIHIPLYQKSYGHRVKRYNGARDWHYLQTPYAAGASSFCNVYHYGLTYGNSASGAVGCAPDSVGYAKCRVFNPSWPTQKEKTSCGETREYSP